MFHNLLCFRKPYLSKLLLCQDLVQVKMRNFPRFNPPKAQPQCVFFHTLVRIRFVLQKASRYSEIKRYACL